MRICKQRNMTRKGIYRVKIPSLLSLVGIINYNARTYAGTEWKQAAIYVSSLKSRIISFLHASNHYDYPGLLDLN